MKVSKIVFFALAFGMSTYSIANTSNVDCDSLKVEFSNDFNDDFKVNATWVQPAKFPNPSKTIKVGDGEYSDLSGNVDFEINCPKIKLSYDGNLFEAKGSSYNDVLSYIQGNYEGGKPINLYYHHWYMYPEIRVDSRIDKYSFDLSSLKITSWYAPIVEGKEVISTSIESGTVIGYRVDGGELKPLIYENQVGHYKDALNHADVFDIYHKNIDAGNKGGMVQRIHVDKQNGLLRVYRKHDFPES